MRRTLPLFLFAGLLAASPVAAATLVVCPQEAPGKDCTYRGDDGLQQAADAAADGDVIVIRAGVYTPRSYRDVPYQDLLVRGYVVTEGKNLSFIGEAGTILDGGAGVPSSAFVAKGGNLRFEKLVLRNFRYAEEEDDIYDGHGIFIIGADAVIDSVRIEGVRKMALSIRDKSRVSVSNFQVLDGHIGVWIEEDAELELKNALFRGNDSAAIAAYAMSSSRIANTIIDGNQDDGIYGKEQAAISVEKSLVLRNKPYGARADGQAVIRITDSLFFANEEDFASSDEGGRVETRSLRTEDPRLDENYRPLPGSPRGVGAMGPTGPLW